MRELTNIHKLIWRGKFQDLFLEELGWDNYQYRLSVAIDSKRYNLQGIAQKRGVVVYLCNNIPPREDRNTIHTQIERTHRENLLIFSDKSQFHSVWRYNGGELREHIYSNLFPNYHLETNLEGIRFSLGVEDRITLIDVLKLMQKGFDFEPRPHYLPVLFQGVQLKFLQNYASIHAINRTRKNPNVPLVRTVVICSDDQCQLVHQEWEEWLNGKRISTRRMPDLKVSRSNSGDDFRLIYPYRQRIHHIDNRTNHLLLKFASKHLEGVSSNIYSRYANQLIPYVDFTHNHFHIMGMD